MANEDLNLVNQTAGPRVHNTEKKPDRKHMVREYKGNNENSGQKDEKRSNAKNTKHTWNIL